MLTVVLFIFRRRLAADGTHGDVRHVNVGLGGRTGNRRQQADSINPLSATVRVLKYMNTRDLPGIALVVITFFMTLFTKKKMNFWTNAPFLKFYNMIVKTSQQWFKINVKNAFGCPLRLGLYLKVECMNLETNFSRIAESQRLWQGAICNVWTSQFDKHWRQSQNQLQKYNIRDEMTE